MNASATRFSDPIHEFPNALGVFPSPAIRFPGTRFDFVRLSTIECNEILTHYGLPNHNDHYPASESVRRLLGIPPL